jgi:hypothetical protein
MIKIEKVGEWDAVQELVDSLQAKLAKVQAAVIRKFGLEAVKKVVAHIHAQDLPYEPLSDGYIEQKQAEGSPTDFYNRTGKFKDNIVALESKDGVAVGLDKSARTDGGELYSDIAAILEFGSQANGLPARPLFTPTLQEMLVWLSENMESIIKENIE